MTPWKTIWPLAALLALGCVAPSGLDATDLGDFEALGKADAVDVEVPFEIEPGQELTFDLRTVGRLHVDLQQDGTAERLQLVAESTTYRRRSWRGRAPFLRIPGTRTAGILTEYTLTLVHQGDEVARGTLHISTVDPDEPGITLVANQPDCEDCDDPAGGLRVAILDAIQNATVSIDFAVYGLNDQAIVDALCEAHQAGVLVRVVSDSEGATEPGQTYYAALKGERDSLASCGVPVELIDYSGIMHNKYFVIDAGTDAPVLVTGSANQTTAGFEVNHNHMLVIRGSNDLLEQYAEEFQQLYTHCEANGCAECTPACIADMTPEGPYEVGDASVRLFFSPSDDALAVLRGSAISLRRDTPDPECGLDGDCVCNPSGSRWRCHYCGLDGDWGLMGDATERVLSSTYLVTDACFTLAMGQAHERGVETTLIIDKVNAGSPYSSHTDLCEMGVPTLVAQWGGGSGQARNHHKIVVVDDVTMTGSMNISAAGVSRNHENTLLIDDRELADVSAQLIRDEASLLSAMGVDSECGI